MSWLGSKSRDEEEAAEFESSQHDATTKVGEVVLVGFADTFEQTVQAQAFEAMRDLGGRETDSLAEHRHLS